MILYSPNHRYYNYTIIIIIVSVTKCMSLYSARYSASIIFVKLKPQCDRIGPGMQMEMWLACEFVCQ